MALPTPEFPFRVRVESGLVSNEPAMGPILRGNRRGTGNARRFQFPVKLGTQTEADDTFTDHAAQKGRASQFSYTPAALGESAKTVRFGEDDVSSRYSGGPAGHALEVVLDEDVTPI